MGMGLRSDEFARAQIYGLCPSTSSGLPVEWLNGYRLYLNKVHNLYKYIPELIVNNLTVTVDAENVNVHAQDSVETGVGPRGTVGKDGQYRWPGYRCAG